MPTTFEMIEQAPSYLWKRNRNYASLPTNDVEIIEEREYHCRTCGGVIIHVEVEGRSFGQWIHTNPDDAANAEAEGTKHWTTPRHSCSYCGTDDPQFVTFTHAAWSDDTNCTRCGGYLGFPIGD